MKEQQQEQQITSLFLRKHASLWVEGYLDKLLECEVRCLFPHQDSE